jgi:hypothetical protein
MTIKTFGEKTFLIHGDGKQIGYKRMKKVFTNPFSNGFSDGYIRYWSKLAQYLSVKTN